MAPASASSAVVRWPRPAPAATPRSPLRPSSAWSAVRRPRRARARPAAPHAPQATNSPPSPPVPRVVVRHRILFGDLVGFTTLSESRDAEDVRELLGRYFDECRQIVARYGGTVEKFIGDAVMAVWGVPTAHEDDAERAVRAGLELVAAVREFGHDVGAPDLALRVGVVTGEVAVTTGATQQGMVAGDAVNTAARVQSVAQPGSGLRRRDDQAADRRGDHLRRRRLPHPQGQGRPRPAVVGARRGRRGRGCSARRRPRSAVGRSRPRAAADQGAAAPVGGDTPPHAAGRRRRTGGRQDPAGVGVREVRRRAHRHRPLALRALRGLRRGRGLLRPRRSRPRTAPGRRGRGRPDRRAAGPGAGRARPRHPRARLAACTPGDAARHGREPPPGQLRPRGPVLGLDGVPRTGRRRPPAHPGHRRRPARRRRAAGLPRAPRHRRHLLLLRGAADPPGSAGTRRRPRRPPTHQPAAPGHPHRGRHVTAARRSRRRACRTRPATSWSPAPTASPSSPSRRSAR